MTESLLTIDGAYGEGGGQIIRTALALSLITKTLIHIENIRAGRKKPGLLRQHLACVKAAKAIGQAMVTGDELGSSELTFAPHTVQIGSYQFDIGSAGSTTLVLQTILPALMLQNAPSHITITGGTHNPMAPPVEYIQYTFLPVLSRLGFEVKLTCTRAGFAPIGGGEIVCEIAPRREVNNEPLQLIERGKGTSLDSTVVLANLPDHIAEREHESLRRTLKKEASLPLDSQALLTYDGISQGNMAMLTVTSNNHCETFTELGAKKVTAEEVGKRLSRQVQRYFKSSACVDEYTADQLLLPMALTNGGEFTARMISEHTRTQAYMIEQFLPVTIIIDGKHVMVKKTTKPVLSEPLV